MFATAFYMSAIAAKLACAIATNKFYKNMSSFVIDEDEYSKLKGRNQTDHTAITIKIQKDIAKIKKENKISYQQNLQYKLTTDKPNIFEDLEQLIYDNAVKAVGRIQTKNTKLFTKKRNKRSHNHFHNILRLLDVFTNFLFTTSETMRDYYLETWYIKVASQIAKQLKT